MNRQFCVAMLLVAGAAIATANSWASVPDPQNSQIVWRRLICSDTKAFVSPSGSGSYLDITARDQFNAPMGGVLVTATFEASCDTCMITPVQGITDVSGHVDLQIYAGLDLWPDPACCQVTTTVTCFGVTLHTDTMQWTSSDLNGDCVMDLLDIVILMYDWFTNACRTDLNCDGVVDSWDFDILLPHWCPFISNLPSRATSCWSWKNLQTGPTGSRPLVCPDGDGPSYIHVCLKDCYGNPVVDYPVMANFVTGCLDTCKQVMGVTDGSGHVDLMICGGLEVSGGAACCPITTFVGTFECNNVVIPYWTECCPPGGGGPFQDDGGMEWLSPDLTQGHPSALKVEGLDYSLFAIDWLGAACRSDYDCDGAVGGLDYSIFALHWLHDCSSCP